MKWVKKRPPNYLKFEISLPELTKTTVVKTAELTRRCITCKKQVKLSSLVQLAWITCFYSIIFFCQYNLQFFPDVFNQFNKILTDILKRCFVWVQGTIFSLVNMGRKCQIQCKEVIIHFCNFSKLHLHIIHMWHLYIYIYISIFYILFTTCTKVYQKSKKGERGIA